ncbi:MAG: NADH-quinone oxidoreductase subunit NuoK [Actinomycetota bacterium]
MPVSWVLILTTALFCVGIYGVLARRNAVVVLMSIEVMLNAVNLNFIAFNNVVGGGRLVGQVFALFVITIAAAELGVGLAIVLLVYRNRFTVSLDEVNLLKW